MLTLSNQFRNRRCSTACRSESQPLLSKEHLPRLYSNTILCMVFQPGKHSTILNTSSYSSVHFSRILKKKIDVSIPPFQLDVQQFSFIIRIMYNKSWKISPYLGRMQQGLQVLMDTIRSLLVGKKAAVATVVLLRREK